MGAKRSSHSRATCGSINVQCTTRMCRARIDANCVRVALSFFRRILWCIFECTPTNDRTRVRVVRCDLGKDVIWKNIIKRNTPTYGRTRVTTVRRHTRRRRREIGTSFVHIGLLIWIDILLPVRILFRRTLCTGFASYSIAKWMQQGIIGDHLEQLIYMINQTFTKMNI